jgi:hypothetical protein
VALSDGCHATVMEKRGVDGASTAIHRVDAPTKDEQIFARGLGGHRTATFGAGDGPRGGC